MNLDQALLSLGVRNDTLTSAEKTFLDENGYLHLEIILSAGEVAAFNHRLKELALQEGEDAGKEVHQEKGTTRLSNLIDKDRMFEKCIRQPKVLAAISHVLAAEFKLSSLNYRAALPGQGLQGLHTDWHEAVPDGNYQVCNSIWLLDDFTPENGATRIIPGTQKHDKRPWDVMEDATADHPDQVVVEAKAGSVVIFNSHTWHGGVLNRTSKPRRAMHCYFCCRNQDQQTDQRKYLRQETIDRLSPESRVILDVA
jgi:ectoine hydroxylase-related dioxygenase (phytanoyl-CoA dioxygenase family)